MGLYQEGKRAINRPSFSVDFHFCQFHGDVYVKISTEAA